MYLPTNCSRVQVLGIVRIPLSEQNPSVGVAGTTMNPKLYRRLTTCRRDAKGGKAKVVGLYGISGSGKTFLLDQMK